MNALKIKMLVSFGGAGELEGTGSFLGAGQAVSVTNESSYTNIFFSKSHHSLNLCLLQFFGMCVTKKKVFKE